MKANNGSGDNESRDSWETPQWLWDKLYNQYRFTFDCCANVMNHKHHCYTVNFLEWSNKEDEICWMNPPFSKAEEMFNHFLAIVRKGVAIYRCDNFETRLWQEIIFPHVDWVFIPHGRISYEGMEGNGSRFPSALIGIGVPEPVGLEGTCLHIRRKR